MVDAQVVREFNLEKLKNIFHHLKLEIASLSAIPTSVRSNRRPPKAYYRCTQIVGQIKCSVSRITQFKDLYILQINKKICYLKMEIALLVVAIPALNE